MRRDPPAAHTQPTPDAYKEHFTPLPSHACYKGKIWIHETAVLVVFMFAVVFTSSPSTSQLALAYCVLQSIVLIAAWYPPPNAISCRPLSHHQRSSPDRCSRVGRVRTTVFPSKLGAMLCVCVWVGGGSFDMYRDTFTLGAFSCLSALPKFILYFFSPVDLDGNVPDLQVAH